MDSHRVDARWNCKPEISNTQDSSRVHAEEDVKEVVFSVFWHVEFDRNGSFDLHL
jgi:hypothetical protein